MLDKRYRHSHGCLIFDLPYCEFCINPYEYSSEVLINACACTIKLFSILAENDIYLKYVQEIGVFKNQRRGGSNITNEYTEILRIPAEVIKMEF